MKAIYRNRIVLARSISPKANLEVSPEVILVGFSRIGLGAHFLTDVLAAIIFGILWLMFCMVLGKSMHRRTVASATSAQPSQDRTIEIAR
jgi:hypothetical protein